jgi:hypothetical protein
MKMKYQVISIGEIYKNDAIYPKLRLWGEKSFNTKKDALNYISQDLQYNKQAQFTILKVYSN